MNFEECMRFIDSYSRLGGKITDLSRAEELMERIGNPEKRLKFVHIAGTNGKGSTLEYIANALTYSGYKTGKLTSPFVMHYTDRIRIDDREIDEKALGEICEFVAERVADRKYSQFEITMAIAFLWFVREQCDIVVLETGIGGLLDSTNVIPPPLVAVITSISLDHTAILGETISEIAAQKAGIIKSGSAVILSGSQCADEIEDVIYGKAKSVGADIIQLESCISAADGDLRCSFIYDSEKYTPSMFGVHQLINAETAITACRYLCGKGFDITKKALRKAIETTRVKARVQYIEGKPPVIVDGAHNPDGVSALADDVLRKITEKQNAYVVIGMMNSKDYTECMDIISPYAEKMWTVSDFSTDAVSAEELAEIASDYTDAKSGTLNEAVEEATALALENDGIVVICGSLYLASEYLNMYKQESENEA